MRKFLIVFFLSFAVMVQNSFAALTFSDYWVTTNTTDVESFLGSSGVAGVVTTVGLAALAIFFVLYIFKGIKKSVA